jgi:glycosyltransferase involved in cell wall biosynthesis
MPAWPDPPETAPPDLPDRAPLIGCFGHLNAAKRIPQLLEAFARLRARRPEALLVLAGPASPRLRLEERLALLGLEHGRDVLVLPYVDEARLWGLIRRCDVCVSLRAPTMGETSGMVIRMLSAGKPAVVSDVGWFSELPDAVAAKVPVDEWEIETLAAVLELLADDADLSTRMGEAAREFARREHALDRTAELYAAALEETAGGSAVEETVFRDVARAAGEVGLRPEGAEVGHVAERMREVGFGA